MKDIRAVAIAIALAGISATATAAPVTFSAVGPTPAAILSTVDSFRSTLGASNGNGAPQPGGRRDITWDGGDAASAPNFLPANFFNTTAPRGVVFSSLTNQFMQSGDGDPVTALLRFDNLLTQGGVGTGTTEFQAFSSPRLFTSVGTNVMDVDFFLAGTTTPALTRAFGVVFTDVEEAGSTFIEFYDANGILLDTANAPASADEANLSFIGLDYGTPTIARVRIRSGLCALPNTEGCDNVGDVVVMDDFIYGEPQAAETPVPAPASLVLLGAALAGLAGLRRRA